MSKSRNSKYFMEEEEDVFVSSKHRKIKNDKRKERKLKNALKTRDLDSLSNLYE